MRKKAVIDEMDKDPLADMSTGVRFLLVLVGSVCVLVAYVTVIVDNNHTDTEYAAGDSGLTNSNVDSAYSVLSRIYFLLLCAITALLWYLSVRPWRDSTALILALAAGPVNTIIGWTWVGIAGYMLDRHDHCSYPLNQASSTAWIQKCYSNATALYARYQPSNPDPTMSLSPDTTFVLGFVFMLLALLILGLALILVYLINLYQWWYSHYRRRLQYDVEGSNVPAPAVVEARKAVPWHERGLATVCANIMVLHIGWKTFWANVGSRTKSSKAVEQEVKKWHRSLANAPRPHRRSSTLPKSD